MDQVHKASAELSVLVQSVWSRKYYDVLLAELPFRAAISNDYEGEIQNLGDTVKISTFPEFDEGSELAEDQRSDASSITVTQQSLVINKRVAKDFIVTNKAMLQSLPMVDKLRDLAIYAINKRIQSIIVALIIPSASAPDHTIAYDSSTTLALADALEAKELLDAQDVPLSERHCILGAAQLNDLFNITGFTSTDFGASNAPLQNGNLPSQICSFMPHFCSLVGNTSTWFHRSFMTIAAQQGMAVNEYDLGGQGVRGTRINCDTLLGVKQLDNQRVVTLS